MTSNYRQQDSYSPPAGGEGGTEEAEPLPPDAPAPRLCDVRKEYPEQEYGFNLHAERGKGQFIGHVDADSPAAAASLKSGDKIIAVNGHNILEEPHKERTTKTGVVPSSDKDILMEMMRTVVRRIKDNPLGCQLLVIEESGMSWYRERKIPIRLDQSNIVFCSKYPQESPPILNGQNGAASNGNSNPDPDQYEPSESAHSEQQTTASAYSSPAPPSSLAPTPGPTTDMASPAADEVVVDVKPRPRLCVLAKSRPSDEYGFNLHAERGHRHSIGKVDANSIGERSGLEEGQRIVGINGVLIYRNTPHPEVVNLIKQDPNLTKLLVASPAVDNYYEKHGLVYAFEDAEVVVDTTTHGGSNAHPSDVSSFSSLSSPNTNLSHHHHQPTTTNGRMGPPSPSPPPEPGMPAHQQLPPPPASYTQKDVTIIPVGGNDDDEDDDVDLSMHSPRQKFAAEDGEQTAKTPPPSQQQNVRHLSYTDGGLPVQENQRPQSQHGNQQEDNVDVEEEEEEHQQQHETLSYDDNTVYNKEAAVQDHQQEEVFQQNRSSLPTRREQQYPDDPGDETQSEASYDYRNEHPSSTKPSASPASSSSYLTTNNHRADHNGGGISPQSSNHQPPSNLTTTTTTATTAQQSSRPVSNVSDADVDRQSSLSDGTTTSQMTTSPAVSPGGGAAQRVVSSSSAAYGHVDNGSSHVQTTTRTQPDMPMMANGDGGRGIRNISLKELKKELEGKKKRIDPKYEQNNTISLQQKYDIIKNL